MPAGKVGCAEIDTADLPWVSPARTATDCTLSSRACIAAARSGNFAPACKPAGAACRHGWRPLPERAAAGSLPDEDWLLQSPAIQSSWNPAHAAHLHSRYPATVAAAGFQPGRLRPSEQPLPPLATVQPAQPALLIEGMPHILRRCRSGSQRRARRADRSHGRIKAIGAHPLNVDASERIDARGKLLLPGLIDMHCTSALPRRRRVSDARQPQAHAERLCRARRNHGAGSGQGRSELHDLAAATGTGKTHQAAPAVRR